MKRGEIYYVNKSGFEIGSEQFAGRPAIIVNNDKNNEHSEIVQVVYLTTSPKNDLPTHVEIRSTAKLSVAICEQITSVSVQRLGERIGACTDSEMLMVDMALAISLGLDLSEPKPKKIVENKPAPVLEKSHAEHKKDESAIEIVRLQAERDTYKDLCDRLIEKLGLRGA